MRSSSVDASVPLSWKIWKSWACCSLQNVPKCRLETLLGPQVNYCSILEGQIEHWFRGIRMLRNVAKLSVSLHISNLGVEAAWGLSWTSLETSARPDRSGPYVSLSLPPGLSWLPHSLC